MGELKDSFDKVEQQIEEYSWVGLLILTGIVVLCACAVVERVGRCVCCCMDTFTPQTENSEMSRPRTKAIMTFAGIVATAVLTVVIIHSGAFDAFM